MAGAVLSFIFNAAGIASFGVSLSEIQHSTDDANSVTHVELIAGSGDGSMGGAMPNIALWNEDGNRLGQFHRKSQNLKEGADEVITIKHNQYSSGADQATYILLSNPASDAVCISAIYVTDTKVNTVVFGDVAKECGMSWGISQRDIGDAHQRPSCVWLDGDGTNGINAQALSLHLPDMVANPDRLKQYQERIDSLCSSSPRLSFWGDLSPDSEIPFFKPELEYEVDSSNGGIGADKDVDRVIDKKTFDKSVTLYQGGNAKRRRARRSGLTKRNPSPGTLIVTPYLEHSAQELCESETAVGPDTVSLNERLFCDMDTRSIFPLCGDGIQTGCFDLDSHKLIPNGNSTAAFPMHHGNSTAGFRPHGNFTTGFRKPHIEAVNLAAVVKDYTTVSHW